MVSVAFHVAIGCWLVGAWACLSGWRGGRGWALAHIPRARDPDPLPDVGITPHAGQAVAASVSVTRCTHLSPKPSSRTSLIAKRSKRSKRSKPSKPSNRLASPCPLKSEEPV